MIIQQNGCLQFNIYNPICDLNYQIAWQSTCHKCDHYQPQRRAVTISSFWSAKRALMNHKNRDAIRPPNIGEILQLAANLASAYEVTRRNPDMIPSPTPEWVVDKGNLIHVAGFTQTAEAISVTIFTQRNTHCTPEACWSVLPLQKVPTKLPPIKNAPELLNILAIISTQALDNALHQTWNYHYE